MAPSRSTEAANALDYWSTHHEQSHRVTPEGEDGGEQDHRYHLARFIAAIEPAPQRVWELGCSSGRNLAVLRSMLPNAYLGGIEPNPLAEMSAARHPPGTINELLGGDDRVLERFGNGVVDVMFTCSVLDHIPNPEWRRVYDQMRRVANTVVIYEPIMTDPRDSEMPLELRDWAEGNVTKDFGIAAAPYSYVHDYFGHDPTLVLERHLPIPARHWPEFGALYHIMRASKDRKA